MSDSILVAGRGAAAIGCQPVPDPELGPPGVRLVFYLPERDRGGEIFLDPEAATRLGRALVAAGEHTQNRFHAWILQDRGVSGPPAPTVPDFIAAEE